MPNVILLTSVELEAEVSTSSGRSLKGGGMRLLLAVLRPAPTCLNFRMWYFKCFLSEFPHMVFQAFIHGASPNQQVTYGKGATPVIAGTPVTQTIFHVLVKLKASSTSSAPR